ncbi:MAG: MltA domain-containing protein [Cyanobacteria bacterium P01_G01_bin.4]
MVKQRRRCQLVAHIGGIWIASALWAVLASPQFSVRAQVDALVPVPSAEIAVEAAWDEAVVRDREKLQQAVTASLRYLNTPSARADYRDYPIEGITLERVRDSLLRFHTLLDSARTDTDLQAAVLEEFEFYQAVGTDGQGTVEITGYFTPTYRASRTPTDEHRYPLFQVPSNFAEWQIPHPTRQELEGTDGLQGQQGLLAGQELVWLSDRLEAFLIQVQGSAQLELEDGGTLSVGYAGGTDYPYTSIGKQLVADGVFTLEELTLPKVLDHFAQNPAHLDDYIPRNQRFVFFEETTGSPPLGSLGVPVVAGRSIATDKTLMPPGALALLNGLLPQRQADGSVVLAETRRFVLDHDTGSAIQGPGRVDVFSGIGDEAKAIAGDINHTGQLFYLLLKEDECSRNFPQNSS